MLKWFIVFLLFFLCSAFMAEPVNFDRSVQTIPSKLIFRHIPISNIKKYSISSYSQATHDSVGNLWVGSRSGLLRFNGRELSFYKQHTDAVDNRFILSLTRVDEDVLMFGVSMGMQRFDISEERFSSLEFEGENTNSLNLPAGERARSFLREENARTVLVGTNSHLLRYDLDTGSLEEVEVKGITRLIDTGETNTEAIGFNTLYLDNNDKLWVGTQKRGLISVHLDTQQFDIVSKFSDEQSDINLTGVSTIIPHPNNPKMLLVGSAHGAFSFNKVTKKLARFPEDSPIKEPINTIALTKSGNVWLGGIHTYHWNKGRLTKYHRKKDFNIIKKASKVNSIYVDEQGSVFVFYGKSGVFRASPFTSKAQALNDFQIKTQEVWALKVDSKNRAWVGFQKGVFYGELSGSDFKFKEAFMEDGSSFDDVYELHSGINGEMWVAETDSLTRLSEDGKVKTYDLSDTVKRIGNIRDFVQDKNGIIWIRFKRSKGLELFDPDTGQVTPVDSVAHLDLSTYFYTKLFVSPKRDKILFSTSIFIGFIDVRSHELMEDRQEVFASYQAATFDGHKDRNRYFFKVSRSSDSNMVYFAHSRNGITAYSWDCNCFNYIEFPFPNHVEMVASIDNNLFWMLDSNKSLIAWNKKSGWFRELTTVDGLPLTGLYKSVGIGLPDGRALMGSNGGPVAFDLKRLTKRLIKPTTYLEKLFINNKVVTVGKDNFLKKSLAYMESLNLTHEQSDFAISFISSISEDQENIGYKYRLLNYKDDWIQATSNKPIASYTNLGHGEYVFEVKSSNNEGVWSEPTKLNITITPSIWNTNIAYILYVLLSMLMLYLLIVMRTQVIKRKNEQLKAVVREKTKESEMRVLEIKELLGFKENFIFNFTHELKSMLQLQDTTLENLSDSLKDKPDITKSLEKSNKTVSRIVHQLLDLAKMKSRSKIKMSLFDVGNLLRLTIPLYQSLADAGGIVINIEISKEPLIVEGEPDSIERIFTNLISNAIKYNRAGGSVDIKAFIDGEEIKIIIADNGYGISQDSLPDTFTYEGSSGSVKSKPRQGISHGIGLDFVQEATQQNNVEVLVDSQPGVGTTFSLTFVRLTDVQPDSLALLSVDADEHFVPEFLDEEDSKKVELIREALIQEHSRDQVLLIDDNLELLHSLSLQLNKTFNLLIATDGEEGIDIALEHCPDLILTDLNMPGKDGYEVIKAVKASSTLGHIPVMLLTAVSSKDVQVEGLKLGADDVISKPAKSKVITQKIKNRLSTNRQLMESLFSNLSPDVVKTKTIEFQEIPTTHQAEEKSSTEWVAKLNKYIELNMMSKENLLIPEVAKHMGCRQRFLSDKVSKFTKCKSIRVYIKEYRLRLADKELRREGYTKVEGVALEHGFTPEAFSTEYTKLFKINPKDATRR